MTESKNTSTYHGNVSFEEKNIIKWSTSLSSKKAKKTLSKGKSIYSEYFMLKNLASRVYIDLSLNCGNGSFKHISDDFKVDNTCLSFYIETNGKISGNIKIDICDEKMETLSSFYMDYNKQKFDALPYSKILNVDMLHIFIDAGDVDCIGNDTSKFLDSEKFTDVTILVDDRKFKCHKVILSSKSKYFEKLFLSSPKKEVINITDCSATIFEHVVKFIYRGVCDFSSTEVCGSKIDDDLLINILLAAKIFYINSLIAGISNILTFTMCKDNIVNRYLKAKKIGLEELLTIVEDYIDEMPDSDKTCELASQCLEIPEYRIMPFFKR